MSLASQLEELPLPFETVRVESDGHIAIASWGPFDVDLRAALSRQSELAAPAKLALSREGRSELRAEVLRVGGIDAPKLALDALDVARAWLAEQSPAMPEAPAETEQLAAGLAGLPRAWAWERAEEGFRIHATGFGQSVRLAVEAIAGGARVIARSALPTPDPVAADAIARFALDANRRLRLARIGVSAPEGDAVAVTWDAVTPSGVLTECGLPAAVEAVVRANAATRRSLRALADGDVARIYLDLREAAPQRCP